MCGIAGFYGASPPTVAVSSLLHRMIRSIAHRGPDADGMHVEEGVGLAHARLSIIDHSAGQQPMSNEDGSVWITFNGEIFNYVELHEDLVARGHVFRTQSDTETIVHQYEESGPDCVRSFNGDFAFAIYDRRLKRLMLARDRMGVRPVYYAIHQGTLYFASEMKALFQVPGLRAELDPVALDQVFTFWFPLAPRTPFKGIQELPPGHVLIADTHAVTVRPYWQLSFPAMDGRADDRVSAASPSCEPPSSEPPSCEKDIADELRELLIDATRIRLRADVPVGAYLSGRSFPDVIRHTERPVVRTAPAPLLTLSRLARQNSFKVVLTGEGADEVFAGYDIFKEDKIRRFMARQPNSKWRGLLLRRLYSYLAGIQGQPQAYLEAFFRTGIQDPGNPFFSHLPRWTMTARIKGFFSGDLQRSLTGYDAMEDLRSRLPGDYAKWHPLSRAQYLESAWLLPAYILSSQGDRVAMAHAVEGRFPFLDHRVVEFAARIPPRLKLKGLREKHILRESLTHLLPSTIANRPKQPYRAPDSQSFFGPQAPEYAQELLSERAIAETGYFDAPSVAKLVCKCRSAGALGFRDNMALVGILSVQLLDQLFVRGDWTPAQAGIPASIHGQGDARTWSLR